MTSRPRPLSAFLRVKGMNARPITWPTVPKGRDRIRVCLHYGNSHVEVQALAEEMVAWARIQVAEELVAGQRERVIDADGAQGRVLAQSKL